MTTKAIPEGSDVLIPSFIVRDAAKAIEFYKSVFGATEIMRLPCSDSGKIAHAELKIRGHMLMLGDEAPEMGMLAPAPGGGLPPSSIMIYFEDVDAVYQTALSHGARSVMAPADMFWGDRFAKFIDPFGHQWGIATHVRDVSNEECAQAVAEWSKEKTPA
jgi:PhnB protein